MRCPHFSRSISSLGMTMSWYTVNGTTSIRSPLPYMERISSTVPVGSSFKSASQAHLLTKLAPFLFLTTQRDAPSRLHLKRPYPPFIFMIELVLGSPLGLSSTLHLSLRQSMQLHCTNIIYGFSDGGLVTDFVTKLSLLLEVSIPLQVHRHYRRQPLTTLPP